jgi:hypothetical protein
MFPSQIETALATPGFHKRIVETVYSKHAGREIKR